MRSRLAHFPCFSGAVWYSVIQGNGETMAKARKTSGRAKNGSPSNGKRGLSPIYLDPPKATRAPGAIARPRSRRLIVFGWYGGKFSHLDWLLPLLPEAHHYCEPFAGSGAVLLNRKPSPVETFNDLDGEVVNFFRVLREQKQKLVEAIGLTPFSREELSMDWEFSL